jgi:hypothetical protein
LGEGPNVRRFQKTEVLEGMRRKQKTPQGGWPAKVGVELRDMQGAQSMTTASEGRRNDGQPQEAEKEGLLEKVVERNNLNKAYKQVKANRGSHGVDGMEVEELLPYLKQLDRRSGRRYWKGSINPRRSGGWKFPSLTGE